MEKTVEYYMSLPYTVELKPDGKNSMRASIKELPACSVSVNTSESLEEVLQLLKEAQRRRIEEYLEEGWEVPEPPGTDPFWEDFEEYCPSYDSEDVRRMLYEGGVTYFPFRLLQQMWLEELNKKRLAEVDPSLGTPPREEIEDFEPKTPLPDGDIHPVRLGKSLKSAWIKFDAARTNHGYRYIEVLDKPLRTDKAIITALTVLEAATIEDDKFNLLRNKLLEHVKAHPELREKNLEEVLDKLPVYRFVHTRSVYYNVALLRYRRPDFDEYTLEEQLEFVNHHRKRINDLLEAVRKHTAFLDYATPAGITTRVMNDGQTQVTAAALADVL